MVDSRVICAAREWVSVNQTIREGDRAVFAGPAGGGFWIGSGCGPTLSFNVVENVMQVELLKNPPCEIGTPTGSALKIFIEGLTVGEWRLRSESFNFEIRFTVLPAHETPTLAYTIDGGAINFSWPTETDRTYLLRRSLDMRFWVTTREVNGTGSPETGTFVIDGATARFFQLVVMPRAAIDIGIDEDSCRMEDPRDI